MKYLLSFLLIFSFAPVMSQTDNGVLMNQVLVDSVHRRYNPSLGKMVYRIKLDLINNDKRIIKGFLYQTKDSSIVLYDPIGVINRTSSINKNFEYRTWSVDVNRINTLEYRRNNSVGQAAGIGAAITFSKPSTGIIQIRSISGTLVNSYNVFSKKEIKISISSIAKGMYIIVFLPDNSTEMQYSKLIIQ